MFYYRTQFTLDRFGLSLTLNTIVVGSTEILANLVFIRFATGVRRRLALQILILCLMGLLLLLMLIPSDVLQTIV